MLDTHPLLATSQPAPRRAVRPAPQDRPRLSVVIVNYQSWLDTARLARDLLKSRSGRRGDLEVVVMDNQAGTNPLVKKLRRWQGLSLRRSRRNHGFARAVNKGYRIGQGDWILLLNPDMKLPPHFAGQVLRLADRLTAQEPRTGIVGFQLRNGDGSPQHSFGEMPTLPTLLGRLILPRQRRKYSTRRIVGRSEVPWVTGCCLLIRRDCLEEVGGFDERFFLYYEDVDLCKRVRDKGWSIWFEPAIWAFHLRPLQSRQPSPAVRVFTRHALMTYAERHWPAWQRRALAGIVTLEALARRLWAAWNKDLGGVWIFKELESIAQNFARGRETHARKHLDRVVRHFGRGQRKTAA